LYVYLKNNTKEEKAGLARVLAVSGDRTSVAQLEPLTRDPDPDVAQEAIRAMRTLQSRVQ
jgi:hypothetical protein